MCPDGKTLGIETHDTNTQKIGNEIKNVHERSRAITSNQQKLKKIAIPVVGGWKKLHTRHTTLMNEGEDLG